MTTKLVAASRGEGVARRLCPARKRDRTRRSAIRDIEQIRTGISTRRKRVSAIVRIVLKRTVAGVWRDRSRRDRAEAL